MKACEKLLGLCPEILTAWNYRRETIEARTGDAATTSEYRLGDFGRTIARAYDVADASDGDENNASLLTASSVGIARELTLTRRLEASDDGFEARGDDDENDASPSAAKEKKAKKAKKEKKEKKRESSTEKSAGSSGAMSDDRRRTTRL